MLSDKDRQTLLNQIRRQSKVRWRDHAPLCEELRTAYEQGAKDAFLIGGGPVTPGHFHLIARAVVGAAALHIRFLSMKETDYYKTQVTAMIDRTVSWVFNGNTLQDSEDNK